MRSVSTSTTHRMHQRYIVLPLGLAFSFPLAAQQTCSTALPVQAGIHAVDVFDGELPNAPRCAANDQGPATFAVWYAYTASADTIVQLTTDVQGFPQVDTRFHVYTGACSALTCIVGNDNGGFNGTSRASFEAMMGSTYYIVFDDRWSSAPFSFQIEETFYPISNGENYCQFTPSFLNLQGNPLAIVDMDNDGLDDAVAVTQTLVNIHYQQAEGGFAPVAIPTDYADYPASWSLCAGDLDGNGFKDLMYGGGYGVSFMFATDDGAGFLERSGPEYVFSQRSNMVDINNDGHLDAFVCHDVAPNVFYLNNGDGFFTFNQGSLGNSCGNYGSIWVDYDNDGDMDLYVAKCGCDPNDILMRNDGNSQFAQVTGPLGPFDYHQSWSSAWGDFDNDGDMDALVGGSDSPDHRLMRNDGAGVFTNVTEDSGLDRFLMQSIEWVTHDFNNDGLLDIVGGGTIMINLGEMRFALNTYSPGIGGVGDLNGDGSLDVLGQYGLQFGVPNGNHWLRVALHGTLSNSEGIGARITVEHGTGQQIREVRSGDGFRYMSSIMPHFGLGEHELIDRITVRWPSGIIQILEDVAADQVLHITEPISTSVANVITRPSLVAFPNPAADRLWIKGATIDASTAVRLTDLAGRVISSVPFLDGSLPIASLQPGLYTARVVVNGIPEELRFRKE